MSAGSGAEVGGALTVRALDDGPGRPDPEQRRVHVRAAQTFSGRALTAALWEAACQAFPDWPAESDARWPELGAAAARGDARAPELGSRTNAVLVELLGGPGLELVVESPQLDAAAADATGRHLERAAHTLGLVVTWCVPLEARSLEGIVRLGPSALRGLGAQISTSGDGARLGLREEGARSGLGGSASTPGEGARPGLVAPASIPREGSSAPPELGAPASTSAEARPGASWRAREGRDAAPRRLGEPGPTSRARGIKPRGPTEGGSAIDPTRAAGAARAQLEGGLARGPESRGEVAADGPPAPLGFPGAWGGAEVEVRFEPILGRPHPASPAELALHAAIEADAELSGGFAYNAPVRGGSGRRLVVDVLERAGDLVVEVDGFRFHASRRRFADDRHRDFELLAVGRRVLRLTADEILADVPRALDKIRAVRAPRRADALDGGPTTR